MNNFLGSLIGRHQGNSEEQDGFKVQPRPKARFESEPLTSPNLDNDSYLDYDITQRSESGSLLTHSLSNRAKDSVSTEKTQLTQSESQITDTHDQTDMQLFDGDCIDDMNEKFKVLSTKLGKTQHTQKEPIQATANQQFRKKEIVSELTDESKHSTSTDNLALGGLNARIQEILQRIQNQQTEQTQRRNEQQLLHEPSSAGLSNKEITESEQTLIPPKIKAEEIGLSISEHAQKDNKQVNTPAIQHSGLLQIPTWLTEMQTKLNYQWQEFNTKTEVEPVINVTIGRIEVRAVHTETPTQPKVEKKARGVMSLDDYLKQRESRGRA